MSAITYIRNLLTDRNIASIAPTSSFGIERICSKMDFSRPLVVVEYGPATGVITRKILANMEAGSKLLAIDTNESFLEVLRKEIQDPRLSIFHESAANIKPILEKLSLPGENSVHYIISGIPFTFIPDEIADAIVRDTMKALVPGGKFLVYQFLKPETRKAKGIHQHLPKYFQTIIREVEFRNIPPLRIYEAIKA